jgi:hypothetical protein
VIKGFYRVAETEQELKQNDVGGRESTSIKYVTDIFESAGAATVCSTISILWEQNYNEKPEELICQKTPFFFRQKNLLKLRTSNPLMVSLINEKHWTQRSIFITE